MTENAQNPAANRQVNDRGRVPSGLNEIQDPPEPNTENAKNAKDQDWIE
jgi:hypothetical protein